jgi:hypothetical protein
MHTIFMSMILNMQLFANATYVGSCGMQFLTIHDSLKSHPLIQFHDIIFAANLPRENLSWSFTLLWTRTASTLGGRLLLSACKTWMVRYNQFLVVAISNQYAYAHLDAGSHIDAHVTYSPSTWAPSMSGALKWLSRCQDTHARCRSSSVSSYTPTRLLQIGQPSFEKIRLSLCPRREGTAVQYATLSHCWGTSKLSNFSVLNSISLKNLHEGILISELDQVFQDAVFTARSLCLGFLWIDSLCIFQDSKADWRREAPLMSYVYSGAVINIAASIAAGRDVSCFPERDLSLI